MPIISVAELARRFPEIPWTKPVTLTAPDGTSGRACRICIAQFGVAGQAARERLFQSIEEFSRHMADIHGVTKGSPNE